MGGPTPEETKAENKLITRFFNEYPSFIKKITKLQIVGEDDMEEDGAYELHDGSPLDAEGRRKGFPNHSGEICDFPDGWKTWWLIRDRSGFSGIFLNESILRRYVDKPFVFIVEIKDCKPRFAILDKERVAICLAGPTKWIPSTNSKVKQPCKGVPLKFFEEFGGQKSIEEYISKYKVVNEKVEMV